MQGKHSSTAGGHFYYTNSHDRDQQRHKARGRIASINHCKVYDCHQRAERDAGAGAAAECPMHLLVPMWGATRQRRCLMCCFC